MNEFLSKSDSQRHHEDQTFVRRCGRHAALWVRPALSSPEHECCVGRWRIQCETRQTKVPTDRGSRQGKGDAAPNEWHGDPTHDASSVQQASHLQISHISHLKIALTLSTCTLPRKPHLVLLVEATVADGGD